MHGRAMFLVVFVVAASIVLWLQGDDMMFGAWPAKILGKSQGTDKVAAEAFAEEDKPKDPTTDVPAPYASPSSDRFSPAVFAEGARSNPAPPPRDPKLYGERNQPSFATVLGDRARDDLWLACQTRSASCAGKHAGKQADTATADTVQADRAKANKNECETVNIVKRSESSSSESH
jgi:hypothetical protein